MSENIIHWTDEDGTEYNVPLKELASSYMKNNCKETLRQSRKYHLEYLFNSTYTAAIQCGCSIVDAIAKAKDAVKAAGMYDNAMNEAVTDRLNAEFPDDAT